MIALICFIWSVSTAPLKSKSLLEVGNAALRQRMAVLQRKVRGRIVVSIGPRGDIDPPPGDSRALHRAGFRRYWRWKSRGRGGRQPISAAAGFDPADEP